jgi:hypothetical protein
MGRARKPVVEQPEIVLTPGRPLVLGEAPNGKALSAAFLADFARDYEQHGVKVIQLVRERYPVEYFRSLVKRAQVLKLEIGPVGSFDRPASTAEALDRLEQRAGPQARALLKQFLEQMKEVEAK